MCRITMAHSDRHHVSSADLFEQLGLSPSDTYYHRPAFALGKARFAYAHEPGTTPATHGLGRSGPIGCPQMTLGRTLKKVLLRNNLPGDFKASCCR
jgi:hypothetical protein